MQRIDRVMALGAAVRYAALAHDADIDSRPLSLPSRRLADTLGVSRRWPSTLQHIADFD